MFTSLIQSNLHNSESFCDFLFIIANMTFLESKAKKFLKRAIFLKMLQKVISVSFIQKIDFKEHSSIKICNKNNKYIYNNITTSIQKCSTCCFTFKKSRRIFINCWFRLYSFLLWWWKSFMSSTINQVINKNIFWWKFDFCFVW